MKGQGTKTNVLLVFLATAVLIERPANAYIDPSTGSLIFQLLFASFLGLLVAFRSNIAKVKDVVFKRKDSNAEKSKQK